MKQGIALIIISLFLILVPVYAVITYESATNILIVLVLGILFLILGIKSLNKGFRISKILKSGKVGRGIYVTSKSYVYADDESLCYIKFYFKDEYGKDRESKTEIKYTEDEAKYFSLLKDFEIKYDSKYAVITEIIDRRKLLEMQTGRYDSFLTSEQELRENNQQKIAENDNYYVCSYCNNVQAKAGKCERCGAIIRKTQIDN